VTDADLDRIEAENRGRRARKAAADPDEDWAKDRTGLEAHENRPGQFEHADAVILYDDGDVCAFVHDNLGLGIHGVRVAEFFAAARNDPVEDVVDSLVAEVRRLRGEVERLSLTACDNEEDGEDRCPDVRGGRRCLLDCGHSDECAYEED
jgi:hypothetical protein